MTSSRDQDFEALETLSTRLSNALRSIDDIHMALATPCEDWNLAALIDHVAGGNWFTVGILNGATAEEAMANTMALFEDGSATNAQAVSSVHEQLTGFGRTRVLDQLWHHVTGELTGRQILRLRLHDLIVHTWDIEQTLNPPATLPADLVDWGLVELADEGSLTAEHFKLEPGPPVKCIDGEAGYLDIFSRRT